MIMSGNRQEVVRCQHRRAIVLGCVVSQLKLTALQQQLQVLILSKKAVQKLRKQFLPPPTVNKSILEEWLGWIWFGNWHTYPMQQQQQLRIQCLEYQLPVSYFLHFRRHDDFPSADFSVRCAFIFGICRLSIKSQWELKVRKMCNLGNVTFKKTFTFQSLRYMILICSTTNIFYWHLFVHF